MQLTSLLSKILALPWTLYFNFKYLPWTQAKHLPIILSKPHLKACKGKITINAPISTGMIQLGVSGVSIYPNNGIIYENHGGEIIFNGPCVIGSNSAISIGEKAILEIGDDVLANASIKLVCYHNIHIGSHCRIGWDNLLMDTDFHTLTKADGSTTKGFGSIELGHNCWLGTGVLTLKGTKLPPFTTVQARTVLSTCFDIPERSVIGSDTHPIIKASSLYRNLKDDRPNYNK